MGADRESLLKSALELAAKGFRVFPVTPGAAKPPAISGWQAKATTDPEVIRRVWAKDAYNIGIKTGDGLFVLDVDLKKGAAAQEAFDALALSADDQDTFRVRTAHGGWHLYYRTDSPFRNDVEFEPGLDIRCVGGYVVAPGSVLSNGVGDLPYTVANDAELKPLPQQVVMRLGAPADYSAQSAQPVVDLDRADAVTRTVAWLDNEAPLAVEGSGGDDTTYKVAAKIKDFGVSEGIALTLLIDHWNERCSPPWPLEHLKDKVAHAYRYGLNSPGVDHPAAVFGDVQVEPPPQPVRKPSRWFRHGDDWDRNVSWLLYETLPQVGLAVIVGPSNSGKTFLEIELARALATGKAFFKVEPDARGGTAFLFAGTEGSGLAMRLAALEEQEHLPISATAVGDLSARGALGELLEALREEAAYHEMAFGVPLRMVVLETLSASGLVNDENNNAELARALTNLGTIARELGVLFVTSHHPPKNGEGPRGAGAIFGNVDFVMEIRREGMDPLRRVELIKARNAEQRPLGTFTLVKKEVGRDGRGRPITSMSVTMGEPLSPRETIRRFDEVFVQALEFCLIDDGVQIEDRACVTYDAVKQRFMELKMGSKDKSNSNAAFKRAFEGAQAMGVVGSIVFDGDRFLWRREIIDE